MFLNDSQKQKLQLLLSDFQQKITAIRRRRMDIVRTASQQKDKQTEKEILRKIADL